MPKNVLFTNSKNSMTYIQHFVDKPLYFCVWQTHFQCVAQHKYFLLLSTICRLEQRNVVYINTLYPVQIYTINSNPYLQNQWTLSIWKRNLCVGQHILFLHLTTFQLSTKITFNTIFVCLYERKCTVYTVYSLFGVDQRQKKCCL